LLTRLVAPSFLSSTNIISRKAAGKAKAAGKGDVEMKSA
jgi:hypothetical protein